MVNQSPESIAADYWNKYLEHNRLRAPASGRGPDTSAGAFLAWMLEAAGDILRNSSNPIPDPGYIAEKWYRIKRYINDNDWRNSLSEREQEDLKGIRKLIEELPASNDLTVSIKELLVAIAYRFPSNVDARLDKLKHLLGFEKKEVNQMPKKPLYPHVSIGGSTSAFRNSLALQIDDENKAHREYETLAARARNLIPPRTDIAVKLADIANDERRHFEVLKGILDKLWRGE